LLLLHLLLHPLPLLLLLVLLIALLLLLLFLLFSFPFPLGLLLLLGLFGLPERVGTKITNRGTKIENSAFLECRDES
jgi:hypothetical protein